VKSDNSLGGQEWYQPEMRRSLGHMHLNTGHGCATLPVPPQAAWNTSAHRVVRVWVRVYLVRATLPPAQHVFGRLHRQCATPRGVVEGEKTPARPRCTSNQSQGSSEIGS
jgi:hypothetical protein